MYRFVISKMYSKVCINIIKELPLWIIAVFSGYIVLPIFSILVVFPCFLIRWTAIITSKWNEDFLRVLSLDSGQSAIDNLYFKPCATLVLVLGTNGSIPFNKLQERIATLTESTQFPELKCKLSRWMFNYFWEKCRTFDIDDHVRCDNTRISENELEDVLESLASKPFVPDQPLWEIVMFSNLESKITSSAISLRIHHSLSDGYALTNFISHLQDLNTFDDDMKKFKARYTKAKYRTFSEKLVFLCRLIFIVPAQFIHVVLTSLDSNSFTLRSHEKEGKLVHCDNYTEPLEVYKLKEAAKRRGVNLTALIMEGFCSGLRKAMINRGDDISRDITAIYPWPKPGHKGRLTNHMFGIPFRLPISLSNLNDRLEAISNQVDHWHENPLTYGMVAAASLNGLLANTFNRDRKFLFFGSMLISNFVCIPKIGTLFGCEMRWTKLLCGTQIHQMSLFSTAVTINGKLIIAVNGDKKIFPDRNNAKDMVNFIVEGIKRFEDNNNNDLKRN